MAITFNRKQEQEPVILIEGWHYARVKKIVEGKNSQYNVWCV